MDNLQTGLMTWVLLQKTLVKGKRQKVLMQVDVIKLTGSFETKHPPFLIIIPLQFSC